jgi:hypothetical protein
MDASIQNLQIEINLLLIVTLKKLHRLARLATILSWGMRLNVSHFAHCIQLSRFYALLLFRKNRNLPNYTIKSNCRFQQDMLLGGRTAALPSKISSNNTPGIRIELQNHH